MKIKVTTALVLGQNVYEFHPRDNLTRWPAQKILMNKSELPIHVKSIYLSGALGQRKRYN